MPEEFEGLTPEQKIERLRGALAAFAESLKQQGDIITSLSARLNVLRNVFNVVIIKLAKASRDPERFIMDIEKLMETVSEELSQRDRGAVNDA